MAGDLSPRVEDALRLQVARAWLAERKGVAGADAIYETIYDLACHAKSSRTRLKAAATLARMIDPPLKPLDPEHDRSVQINITVVAPDEGHGHPDRPAAQANGRAIRVIDQERNGG